MEYVPRLHVLQPEVLMHATVMRKLNSYIELEQLWHRLHSIFVIAMHSYDPQDWQRDSLELVSFPSHRNDYNK